MHKSTKILLTYFAAALSVAAATSVLTFLVWESSPYPNTLGYEMRLLALTVLPLVGLSLVAQIAGDRLVWRVIRTLRRKELLASGSST